ncbi:MAG: hypothetical protein GF313_15370 [Caldithrix sp.]|nr:hypothetical protein [Caldithrix sp.]
MSKFERYIVHEVSQHWGLVLGSGAARGIAHIGVLKALANKGIKFDPIVGTSMGALIGGAYASGMSIDQMEEIACNTDWRSMARIFRLTNPMKGIFTRSGIEEFIEALIGKTTFNDLKYTFYCVATNLLNGDEIIINKGYLAEAIMASIALPGLFKPISNNKQLLVDGGLVNPLPVDVARHKGADRIIAVNVTPPVDRPMKNVSLRNRPKLNFRKFASSSHVLRERLAKFASDRGWTSDEVSNGKLVNIQDKSTVKSPSIIETMTQSVVIMQNQLVRQKLASHPPDILFEPNVSGFQLLDFTDARALINAGERCVHENWQRYESILV